MNYSTKQGELFLKLAAESLSPEELQIFVADAIQNYSPEYLQLNSGQIQRNLLEMRGSGREIGNFETADVLSPKLKAIATSVLSHPGQTAIYSSYRKYGIQPIKHALECHGLANQIVEIRPDDPVTVQQQAMNAYNTKGKRILLIDPEISEGISLMETEHFHILEPILSEPAQRQIIGKAARYNSHAKLPASR
jgi:hypothetical protein